MDAQLDDFAPERKAGQKGRPRLKGARRLSPEQRLKDRQTKWEKPEVENWYSGGQREVEVCSETCLWGTTGKPQAPIRWVLVRDVLGEFEPCAFLSTELTHEPIQMLNWFVRRWRMDVTFEESRAHLGIETGATMERLGDSALDTASVRTVLAGTADGQRFDSRPGTGCAHYRLVRKRASHLQRCAGAGKTLFVGQLPFSNVAFRRRQRENSALVV
jgi:hypothetical protein